MGLGSARGSRAGDGGLAIAGFRNIEPGSEFHSPAMILNSSMRGERIFAMNGSMKSNPGSTRAGVSVSAASRNVSRCSGPLCQRQKPKILVLNNAGPLQFAAA